MIILGWNRNFEQAWELSDYRKAQATCDAGGTCPGRWSVGNIVNIIPGSDAFLLVQGTVSPRGLIAHGVVTSSPYPGEHWRADLPKGTTCNYVDLIWDQIRDFDEVLPVKKLEEEVPGLPWKGGIQQSGVTVPLSSQSALWGLWQVEDGNGFNDPYEVNDTFYEGARTTITVNAYERDPKARAACLAHYGHSCFTCGLDPVTIYGPRIGPGVINVHHVIPLHHGDGVPRKVDPIKDLRPLCPNCHTAIHKCLPLLTPEEFRTQLGNAP